MCKPFFFLTYVSYFLLNANNTRYNFRVLHFWLKAKVNAYRTDLRYNVINKPFSLVYRQQTPELSLSFQNCTLMHMKITYIQVILSLIIKSHIYQSKYHLLFNQYGDEQNKISSNNVRTI